MENELYKEQDVKLSNDTVLHGMADYIFNISMANTYYSQGNQAMGNYYINNSIWEGVINSVLLSRY